MKKRLFNSRFKNAARLSYTFKFQLYHDYKRHEISVLLKII